MKVAFWSNSNGRAGTTSNMTCISILCAMLEQKKSILFENHYNLNGLEQAFLKDRGPYQSIIKEEFSFYDQRGLDGLIRRVHSNYTYDEIMEDVSLKFLDGLLYYLPKNHDMNHEYFEFELNQVVKPLLSLLDRSFDCVFVDTVANNSLSTKIVLEEADLVVVNLSQNKILLDHFFSNYQSLVEKSIFLVGNYQEKSKYNLKSIHRRYQIPYEILGAIPFHLPFGEAMNGGDAVKYFMRNLECQRQDEDYYFMSQVRKAAQMVLDRMHEKEAKIVS